jgi:hypothetical protein
MNIHELKEKIKGAFSGDIAVVVIIILVGLSSFGLGRLSVTEDLKEPVRIEQSATVARAAADASVASGAFVASRNSSVYHFPWCPGAERIAAENKIWFDSKEEAEQAGYRPAKNCKGL